MKFSELFEKIIFHWPQVIDISDGILDNNLGSFYSKNFTAEFNRIEELLPNDDWEQLMNWIICKASWGIAKENFNRAESKLELLKIPRERFKEYLLEELSEPFNADMLAEFEE